MEIYKGYTILEDNRNPFGATEFMFYPSDEGVQHDADMDQDGYHYCGNCGWASTIEEAKDLIDEKIMQSTPAYLVETIVNLGEFKLKNVTKFWWLDEAIRFASHHNGTMNVSFNNP